MMVDSGRKHSVWFGGDKHYVIHRTLADTLDIPSRNARFSTLVNLHHLLSSEILDTSSGGGDSIRDVRSETS